jgi:hypothetical protein
MKPNLKILAGFLMLFLASLVVMWRAGTDEPPVSPASGNIKSARQDETRRSAVAPAFSGDSAAGRFGSVDAHDDFAAPGDARLAARDAALEKIHDAATTYDPVELAAIRPYLVNADPEIREAAVNGMIVLGDAAAGPMLREAAARMESAEEAKAMLAAADYVELPSANLRELTKRSKDGTEVARPAKRRKK